MLGWKQGADDNFKRTDGAQFGNQLGSRGDKAIQIFVPIPSVFLRQHVANSYACIFLSLVATTVVTQSTSWVTINLIR